MANVQKSIKLGWRPRKGEAKSRIQVVFKVHSDGSMTNLRILKSNASPEEDTIGLAAVNSVGNFGVLPQGAPDDVDIEFTFDYKPKTKPAQP